MTRKTPRRLSPKRGDAGAPETEALEAEDTEALEEAETLEPEEADAEDDAPAAPEKTRGEQGRLTRENTPGILYTECRGSLLRNRDGCF